MKFGIVSLWRDSAEGFVDEVKLAEHYGADIIGVGDSQSIYRELYVSLAIAAKSTERAQIGPMATNPLTRHPAVAVSAIASVDSLSGGRAVFGIGTGGSALWAIEERPARLAYFREYLEAYRALMRTGVADWQGRRIRVDGIQRDIPLVVTAEGPRTLELAGSMADTVVIHSGTSPASIEWCRTHIARGARASGRVPDAVNLWMMLKGSISNDPERALHDARSGLAGSARHALATNVAEKGVPAELVVPIQQLVERYDTASHAMAASENAMLVDELGLAEFLGEQFGLIGTPEQCAGRLTRLAKLGISGVIVPAITADPMDQIARLGGAVMPLVHDALHETGG